MRFSLGVLAAALLSGTALWAQDHSCFVRYLGSVEVNPNSWIVTRLADIEAWKERRTLQINADYERDYAQLESELRGAINGAAWPRVQARLLASKKMRLEQADDMQGYLTGLAKDRAAGLSAQCEAREEEVGALTFVLTWTSSGDSEDKGPDMDIWVSDPAGNYLSSERTSMWGPTDEGGQVDRDDEGGYAEVGDDASGGGPERVLWSTEPPKGVYEFGCKYYEGDGDVECTIEVIVEGAKVGEAVSKAGPGNHGRAFTFDTTERPYAVRAVKSSDPD